MTRQSGMVSSVRQGFPVPYYRTLVLCLFVLLFALQAKTCVYQANSTVRNPVASTKLWLDAHKIGAQSVLPSPEWLRAVTIVFVLCLIRIWHRAIPSFVIPRLPQSSFNPERFFRPPPVL